MTTLREAAQQALEYLDAPSAKLWPAGTQHRIITDLKSALAEPVQAPVAWRTFDGEGGYDYRAYEDNEDYAKQWNARNQRHVGWVEPLYLAPPQRRPLTDEEIDQRYYVSTGQMLREQDKRLAFLFARAIERAHGIGGQDES